MKLRIIVAMVCCIGIQLTACNHQVESGSMEKIETEAASSIEEKYVMSIDQEELLCRISIDEEDVREGKLAKWQKEVLRQYDYAMAYLKRKYPSYTFKIINCEQKNKLNSYTTFGFVEESYPEGYYEMYIDVMEGENGNLYTPKDNFYGQIKEDKFAEKLQILLQEQFGDNIDVDSNMACVMGEEIGEAFDVERLLQGEIDVFQSTQITVRTGVLEEEEFNEKSDELEKFLKERKILGSFFIEFVDEFNPDEILYEYHFFG